MFISDPFQTDVGRTGWSGLGAVSVVTDDQVMLRQLHALAVSIYQAQQDTRAAQARNDLTYVRARVQDVQRLRDLFAAKAAQFRSVDADTLGAIDGFILATGSWIEKSVNVAAAIPGTILDYITKLGVKAGLSVVAISLPVLLLGGLALVFLMQAEKSRTVRRFV